MTYVSPSHNQDGVNRNLAISEHENNRIHKEAVDLDHDRQKQILKENETDNQVNQLKEQDELDPEGRNTSDQQTSDSNSSDQGSSSEGSSPSHGQHLNSERPAHLGGGDFIDFSA